MGRAPISKWSSAVTKSAWRERTLPAFVGHTHAASVRFVLPITVNTCTLPLVLYLDMVMSIDVQSASFATATSQIVLSDSVCDTWQ